MTGLAISQRGLSPDELRSQKPPGRNRLRQSFRQPRIGVEDLCVIAIQVFFTPAYRTGEEALSKWQSYQNEIDPGIDALH